MKRDEPGRVVCLDVGAKVVGVAATDAGRVIVTPLPPVVRTDGSLALGSFRRLFAETAPSLVLVGIPLNPDGSLSEPARNVRAFLKKLRKHFHEIPFATMDESFSTKSAKENYRHLDLRKNDGAVNLDSFAALEILESWLRENEGRNPSPRNPT